MTQTKYLYRDRLLRSLVQAAEIHENVAANTTGTIRDLHLNTAGSLYVTIACVEYGLYDVEVPQEEPAQ